MVQTGAEQKKPSSKRRRLDQAQVQEFSPFHSGPETHTGGFDKSTAQQKLRSFAGMSVEDLIFLEIYAGTARLSKAVSDEGFQCIPIDKTASRSSNFIAIYDVTDDLQLQQLLDFIEQEHRRIIAVHLAPACGTASKARERPLPKFSRKGFKVPKPLRSTDKPLGVDSLAGLDKIRTELANMVYAATAILIRKCASLNILCSLENPLNSLFWLFPDIQKVLAEVGGYDVIFHNCMHGGKRKKQTRWWASDATYQSLALLCDDNHPHHKWTPTETEAGLQFPTTDEAAYPHMLCKRVASIISKLACSFGAHKPEDLHAQVTAVATTSKRWILDMLPKGKKLRPLVSEFQHYITFAVSPSEDPESTDIFRLYPKGTRLVHRQLQRGRVRVDGSGSFEWFEKESEKGKTLEGGLAKSIRDNLSALGEWFNAEICTLGIPRDPWDFVQRAVAVGHPRSLAIHLSQEIQSMLVENFHQDNLELVKTRAAFLMKWSNRCKALKLDEDRLRQNMESHLQRVLQGKRLLLMKEMLLDLGYPDSSLVDEITGGFQLSGWLPKSKVFPPHVKRPQQSMAAVRTMSKGVNKSICKQVEFPADEDMAKEVWQLTLEEVERGWIWFDDACKPEHHVLAKRFGIRQGQKTRLIDDCSIGGFNGTCGSSEKLRVHAVDEISSYLSWCMTELGPQSLLEVVGKTYDLKSAYKQYGIASTDRDILRIAVWDPLEKRVRFLGLNAMPFGAVGSVSSFLRTSMAIWFIGVRGLRLCWSCFFDDFTILSTKAGSGSAALAAESLFRLLGVRFAEDGDKAVTWGTQVKTLGVVLDLAPDSVTAIGSERYVTVGHTPGRVEELQRTIGDILESGSISSKDAERLRGRLQWFESFASGRVAQQALRVVSGLSSVGRQRTKLSQREVESLVFLQQRVLTAPPTRIMTTNLSTWYIFTDGACEGDVTKVGSIGGVLVNPSGVAIEFFGSLVPDYIMNAFLSEAKHPIFELELLPVLVALCTWKKYLNCCQCVFFLDNEAAKGALIHGATKTLFGEKIISAFVNFEMQQQVKVWFSRVPTSSNVSDKPSRMDFKEVLDVGATQVSIPWSWIQELVGIVGS